MVWPILISVSVTPGPYFFSASAPPAHTARNKMTHRLTTPTALRVRRMSLLRSNYRTHMLKHARAIGYRSGETTFGESRSGGLGFGHALAIGGAEHLVLDAQQILSLLAERHL